MDSYTFLPINPKSVTILNAVALIETSARNSATSFLLSLSSIEPHFGLQSYTAKAFLGLTPYSYHPCTKKGCQMATFFK